jgi:spermidine synthase
MLLSLSMHILGGTLSSFFAASSSPPALPLSFFAASLPLPSLLLPFQVLIVGGGDGGVLREVCRHECVEEVVMCEIDEDVVAMAKKHLGGITATSFEDPRLTLLFQDAAVYMQAHTNKFDVIIVDSSDPVGPAEALYTSAFYAHMEKALRPGGIVCTQGECLWLHLDIIQRVMREAKELYPVVDYGYTTVPTYPSGQIGFIMAKKAGEGETGGVNAAVLRTPTREPSPTMSSLLRYYSTEVHAAAFVLPRFAEAALQKLRGPVAVAGPAASGRSRGSAAAEGCCGASTSVKTETRSAAKCCRFRSSCGLALSAVALLAVGFGLGRQFRSLPFLS